MEGLRYIRIAEISAYNLDYATEALDAANSKLLELNSVQHNGNIPRETLLEIHLTTDDIYLLQKRVKHLLDQQLDDYHARECQMWNKVEACKKLRHAVDKDMVHISVSDLYYYVSSSIEYIQGDEGRLNFLRALGESLVNAGNLNGDSWNKCLNPPSE
jgi:hypothetical protein